MMFATEDGDIIIEISLSLKCHLFKMEVVFGVLLIVIFYNLYSLHLIDDT